MLIQRLAALLAALFTVTGHTPARPPGFIGPVAAPAATVTAPAAPPAPPAAPATQPVAPARPALRPVAFAQSVLPAATAMVDGGDVSWPNCSRGLGGYALPMPRPNARFVIVGATDGPAFTRNPCLRAQVAWAKARHLWLSAYAVVHYPNAAELRAYGGRGSLATRLGRVGKTEARYALLALWRAGVRTPTVWVDVETVGGHPWAGRASLNRAFLRGVLWEYAHYRIRAGIYSYAYAWNGITGGWRLPNATWVPSGEPRRSTAVAKCLTRSFSGGHVALGQWTDGTRDYNVTCPGTARTMRSWFAAT